MPAWLRLSAVPRNPREAPTFKIAAQGSFFDLRAMRVLSIFGRQSDRGTTNAFAPELPRAFARQ
jgi:hypothetical protein